MIIANILDVPAGTQALLWDMDGVLIDSLGLDHTICSGLLKRHCGGDTIIPSSVIKDGFALCPHDYWQFIVRSLQLEIAPEALARIVADYEHERRNATFPILGGVEAILEAARGLGLKLGVVSNNAQQDVVDILSRCGLAPRFDVIVGNDHGQFQKKPAPDTYLHAAAWLGVAIERCVILEDSLVGIEAGWRAGAFTIGVATGGTSLAALERAGHASACYLGFTERRLSMAFGDVRNKRILTPNDFVSHMVEHIAWRLGIGIDLAWPDTNWGGLGDRLGRQIRQFEARQPRAAALGMIDDGSAEVYLDLEGEAGFVIEAIANTDLDWFLALRCEQLDSGRPLIELLAGLTAGLGGRLQIRVCSVEDPHHTWEGIFRSVGIALARLFMPAPPPSVRLPSERGIAAAQGQAQGQGRLEVREGTADSASVVRETAESIVSVRAVLAEPPGLDCAMAVAESIDVAAFPRLLERLALAAGLALSVSFTATKLNSSHVVLEDIGLVLGRALLEIFRHRMEGFGVNGAGSSVKTLADYSSGAVRVGVSIEGRKFVKFVPFTASTQSMRKGLLVGPLVYGSIRAEDLDDFLDGLAGGLACSIIVHLRSFDDPEATWAALFEQLGLAIRECLEPNPYRKGLPAGVKATLI